jgi:hypothetical protein
MAARFAGKYDVLDQEVKLGIQILSAVEVATHRRVQIYCLPLYALQIELPCPPEFIERRFRSAVTLEGAVIEADVDPESENAYVVVATAGANPDAGFAAPTMEFNAWSSSAAHQAANEASAGAATMERPAWSTSPASSGKPTSEPRSVSAASPEPAVSFTKLFSDSPAASAEPAVKIAAKLPQPTSHMESAPQAKKQMESFTAFFKMGPASPSPSRSPEVTPEPAAPLAQPVASFAEVALPAPQPQGGGFTAFFSAGKSSQPSPEPQSFATPAPAAFPTLQPAAQTASGGFTQLFGGAPSTPNAGVSASSFPEAQFATPSPMPAATPAPQFTAPASKEPAAGSFTAMFAAPPSSAPATPSAEANFASRFASSEPAAKAPGAFTELFRRMPDLQPSASPATAEPAMPAPPASAQRSDGFTGIFGTPGAAPPSAPPPLPMAAAPSAPSATASPDLAPRLDRPSTATQYGTNTGGAGGAQQQAPAGNRAAGPSEYTKVRKAWSAPPPDPAVPAGQAGAGAAPQMAGGIPALQWPSAPAVPSMPMAPPIAMAPPQMSPAQPQVPGYPGFAPPAAPAWPPVAMPPQSAPAAAPGQAKSKPSYLPLIITLNVLFVLAIIIVLVFVLTKH